MSNEEIRTGDLVKIRSDGERFWCEVMGRDDNNSLQLRVNSYCIVAPYEFGQIIAWPADEVIEVWDDKEAQRDE